ncbi:MAG: hypothetical protein WDA00_05000 [Eubacteriales bacterium]
MQELTVFAMFGALMFASKLAMEMLPLPNVHLLGMFVMLLTVVYRARALVPLYLYVFLNGLFAGFSLWWMPYLYVWTILWGAVMLLPKRMPRKLAMVLYPLLGCLHGLAFGALYAPAQALLFGLNWQQTLAWIAAGLPFDLMHGVGNLVTGLLVVPLSELLRRLNRAIL